MNYSRRVLTPRASNKRREREGFDAPNPYPTKKPRLIIPKPDPTPATLIKSSEPAASSNILLAGYLAHEFLTKGTLFGQKWDPARAEAVPVSAAPAAKLKRLKSIQMAKAEPNVKAEPQVVEKYQRYVEVTNLLRTDGPHIPGIVNPTQLASFLHL